jgi:cysteinyl-tRNA synthetase
MAAAALCGLVSSAEAPRLAQVRSWAYQLQNADPVEIQKSPYDLVVIDYSFDRRSTTSFPREVLNLMRRKPDGSHRFILAYFSIGEAESYRFYWQEVWHTQRPEWLEPENPDWPGNFPVRYWYPEWQKMLFGGPEAYLDRILDAGFDGVYLDGIDQFEHWKKWRATASADMVELVNKIATYARARRKDFVVIPQNGDELLDNPHFVGVIDGFGKEELLHGEQAVDQRNTPASIDYSIQRLRHLTRAGKPALVVEYTTSHELSASELKEIKQLGFVGHVANRDLSTLASPVAGCVQPDC